MGETPWTRRLRKEGKKRQRAFPNNRKNPRSGEDLFGPVYGTCARDVTLLRIESMKIYPALLALLMALCPLAEARKPNFIVIFIDDMGYGDIGPFGSKKNETPHLDRMAKEE